MSFRLMARAAALLALAAVVPEPRIEEGAVPPGETGDVLVIPRAATDLDASRAEFFRVLRDPRLHR